MDPHGLMPEDVRRSALYALWTFPSILASAFVVAWGAEAAQFFVSQGLALALLAWVQVLPEFAVEAVIAWHRDVPLMTANFTGALRLLTGLGWPTIWVVSAFTRNRNGQRFWDPIRLDEEHAAEVVGLSPALLYFAWIIQRGTLTLVDAAVLIGIYSSYLVFINRLPAREREELADAEAPVRAVMALPARLRSLAILALFLAGATALYLVAHPFLESTLALATLLGVSQFVFVQWVAPFLSEFPEFVTTTYWAHSPGKGGMALMNMASSNINQWTVLAAMIPIVYSLSMGAPSAVPLAEHRVELWLTLLQGTLGLVILSNFTFEAYEALGLLTAWLIQFLKPEWREEMVFVYLAWLVIELVSVAWRPGRLRAFQVFPRLWNQASRARP
jgi:cation:H+ antiporter